MIEYLHSCRLGKPDASFSIKPCQIFTSLPFPSIPITLLPLLSALILPHSRALPRVIQGRETHRTQAATKLITAHVPENLIADSKEIRIEDRAEEPAVVAADLAREGAGARVAGALDDVGSVSEVLEDGEERRGRKVRGAV